MQTINEQLEYLGDNFSGLWLIRILDENNERVQYWAGTLQYAGETWDTKFKRNYTEAMNELVILFDRIKALKG